jgi:hypothetical protein
MLPQGAQEAIARARSIAEARATYNAGLDQAGGGQIGGLTLNLGAVLSGLGSFATFEALDPTRIRVSLAPAALEGIDLAYGEAASPALSLGAAPGVGETKKFAYVGAASRGTGESPWTSPHDFARSAICRDELPVLLSVTIEPLQGRGLASGSMKSATVQMGLPAEDVACLRALCQQEHASRWP